MLLVLLTDETARSHPRERTELFPLLRSNYQRELQRDGSFSQVSKETPPFPTASHVGKIVIS